VHDESKSTSASRPSVPAARRAIRLLLFTLLAVVVAAGVPALSWQRLQSQKTRCVSNQRRLATALLLYAQDHDGRLPPVDYRTADGTWRHWVDISQVYISREDVAVCPANGAEGATEPTKGYAFPYSYALNARFFGAFGAGPFPIENLELPAATALFVENRTFTAGQNPPSAGARHALSGYWDYVTNPTAYATPHGSRMNVAAADGHVVTLTIPSSRPGAHDALYGHLAGSIYNWNGGHPNGDTAGPPRQ
jgi:prepilin-type processing-associated H-X9-DG protein